MRNKVDAIFTCAVSIVSPIQSFLFFVYSSWLGNLGFAIGDQGLSEYLKALFSISLEDNTFLAIFLLGVASRFVLVKIGGIHCPSCCNIFSLLIKFPFIKRIQSHIMCVTLNHLFLYSSLMVLFAVQLYLQIWIHHRMQQWGLVAMAHCLLT